MEFLWLESLSSNTLCGAYPSIHRLNLKPNTQAPPRRIQKALSDEFRKIFQEGDYIEQLLIEMSNFKVFNTIYNFSTKGEIDFTDLTDKVQEVVSKSGVKNGLVHVFAPHATGILILTENEHGLLSDIKVLLEEMVPRRGNYRHPSNAHAHLRSVLLPPDKTLPVVDGRVEFGTWQSLLFVETDVYPRRRTIILKVMGEQ